MNKLLTFALVVASIDMMIALIVAMLAPVIGVDLYGALSLTFFVCVFFGGPLAFFITSMCFADEEPRRG